MTTIEIPNCRLCGDPLVRSMMEGEGFCTRGGCALFYKEQPYEVAAPSVVSPEAPPEADPGFQLTYADAVRGGRAMERASSPEARTPEPLTDDDRQRLASIRRGIPHMADVGGVWPRDVEFMLSLIDRLRAVSSEAPKDSNQSDCNA